MVPPLRRSPRKLRSLSGEGPSPRARNSPSSSPRSSPQSSPRSSASAGTRRSRSPRVRSTTPQTTPPSSPQRAKSQTPGNNDPCPYCRAPLEDGEETSHCQHDRRHRFHLDCALQMFDSPGCAHCRDFLCDRRNSGGGGLCPLCRRPYGAIAAPRRAHDWRRRLSRNEAARRWIYSPACPPRVRTDFARLEGDPHSIQLLSVPDIQARRRIRLTTNERRQLLQHAVSDSAERRMYYIVTPIHTPDPGRKRSSGSPPRSTRVPHGPGAVHWERSSLDLEIHRNDRTWFD